MIARLEDAIKQRIAGAKLPYLRTLATYGGEFDDNLNNVVRLFPAIWIAYVGDDEPRIFNTARNVFKVKCRFAVMVGAYNLRNEQATRQGGKKGDGVVVGTYQMISDLRALLTAFDPGDGMEALSPGRTRTLYSAKLNKQALSVMAQEWHSAYLLGTPADGTLPPLEGINIDYRIPPDTPLPVAQDIVTFNSGRES